MLAGDFPDDEDEDAHEAEEEEEEKVKEKEEPAATKVEGKSQFNSL